MEGKNGDEGLGRQKKKHEIDFHFLINEQGNSGNFLGAVINSAGGEKCKGLHCSLACITIYKQSLDPSSGGAQWYIHIKVVSQRCVHCRQPIWAEWQSQADGWSAALTACFPISLLWRRSCRTWSPAQPTPLSCWRRSGRARPQSLQMQPEGEDGKTRCITFNVCSSPQFIIELVPLKRKRNTCTSFK